MFTETHLKIGDKLPEFTLMATNGHECNPYEFKESKIIVVIFTCNHCPYVQAYENRLIKLQKDFADKKVTLIAINANDEINYPEDSFENMVNRVKDKGYNFPYLRDKTQNVAKSFGASFTPEVFVFDQNRTLQYHGRIDDNWQEPDKVTKQNLKEALEAILENKPVNRADTQAIGCTVKWAH